tara:strand:+ start:1039 stop:1437 length:399 start_codon:yes stop_codon:yes gene_type:complete
MRKKICIVRSLYNEEFTLPLQSGAQLLLKKSNKVKSISTISVPGAFEIPFAISKLIKKYDGFVAIGCILKGETANFDLICNAITNGIMQISIKDKKPIGNAILTCFNREQASQRLNKGEEAADAVLKALSIQ